MNKKPQLRPLTDNPKVKDVKKIPLKSLQNDSKELLTTLDSDNIYKPDPYQLDKKTKDGLALDPISSICYNGGMGRYHFGNIYEDIGQDNQKSI